MESQIPASRIASDCVSNLNREILFNTLDSFSGFKVIVWDQKLIKRFDLVAKSDQLKQHDVVSMLLLDSTLMSASVEHSHVIYILDSCRASARKLLKHLKRTVSKDDRRLFHVLFVPDATATIKDLLKEDLETSAHIKTVASLPIRIYPFYDDFFSCFMPYTDWTELYRCASALLQIQLLCKKTPNLRCYGKWAAQTAKILKEIRLEASKTYKAYDEWNVSDIVIVDRWCDPLTPMLYQYTYGGIIDEVFKILPSGGILTTLFENDDKQAVPKEKNLNDDLYFRLRDLHISDVAKAISTEVKEVKEIHQGLRENWDASLTQTKVLVRKLKEIKTRERDAEKHAIITSHITSRLRNDRRFKKIAAFERELLRGDYGDRVIGFIEDLIAEAYSPDRILCLITIQSLVCGGLKPLTYLTYLRLFIQCEYTPFDLHYANKRFGCIDQSNECSVSYPYCGYIPPIVRLVQHGVKNGWKDWTTVASPHQMNFDPKSTTIVYVIGGLTMAEAACLRKINFPNQLFILTTSIISGNHLFNSLERS
uniref:Sec1-like protein n=1 Tax=Syphacia muris TaxID=451379 RepID=A0A0N5AHC9_9BILA